jgi:hypothetical protein
MQSPKQETKMKQAVLLAEDGGEVLLQNLNYFHQIIWCYIPEDRILHSHCCKELKSNT